VSRNIFQQDQQVKHLVRRGICCRTILLLCLGWCWSAYYFALLLCLGWCWTGLFTQGNRVTKNDKETKHCDKYQMWLSSFVI